eukprot:gene28029-36911_t
MSHAMHFLAPTPENLIVSSSDPPALDSEETSYSDNLLSQSSTDSKLVSVNIRLQHFNLLRVIGEGAFGKVFFVQNYLDKEYYAMKVISKKLLRKKNNVQYMKSERDILTRLQHPFIVQLHFAFQSESKLFLVMDFLGGGELFHLLRQRGLILESEIRFYLAEMVQAIEFLHNHNILHRDLKPENVLLNSDGHVAITDFGLAKEIGDGVVARTLCGTSEYMAPEMLTRTGYGKGVDWWALGALCFEMVSGRPPFQARSQKDLDRKIMSEKFTAPPYLQASTHSLLKGLLEKDMNKRLGAAKSTMFSVGGVSALKQHAFFDGIDWNALARKDIAPPINLSSLQQKGGKDLQAPATDADGTPTLTSCFAAEFTDQHISLSMIEETASTTCVSPTSPRSRSKLESVGDGLAPDEEFADFDFADREIQVTEQQLRDLQLQVENKLLKAQRKRQQQEKKKAQLLVEEEKKKTEQLAEDERKKAQAALTQQQAALAKEQAKLLKEKQERRQAMQKRNEQVRLHNAKVVALTEDLAAVRRKIKAVRKKLREVSELEEKGRTSASLSKEQKEKLSRKTELEEELDDLEEEEKLQMQLVEQLGPPRQEEVESDEDDKKNKTKKSMEENDKQKGAAKTSPPPLSNPNHSVLPLPPQPPPSQSKADTAAKVPAPAPAATPAHTTAAHTHTQGGEKTAEPGQDCGCDRLNSSSLSATAFQKEKDQWTTVKAPSAGRKKRS